MVSLTLWTLAAVVTAGNSEPVLLNFSSPACGHCTAMAPVVAQLQAEGFRVQNVDVTRQRQLAEQFQVRGTPCFILLDAGREVARIEGRTDYSRLASLFQTASSSRANAPAIRGQSPATPPRRAAGASAAGASRSEARYVVQRGLEASVRIYVEDPEGRSVGAGTIIDVHGDEAMVLTCGHIFRDSQGKGRITVDLFAGGRKSSVAGVLLSYNLDTDVALISMRPGVAVQAAQIAGERYQPKIGEPVFTIGCDHGQDPNVQHSRITGVNTYVGPANIEVNGAPADGRSGGGLFAADGTLIGVCNGAFLTENEGLYAAFPNAHKELAQLGLTEIYRRAGTGIPSAEPTPVAASTRLVATARTETNVGAPVTPVRPATFDYTQDNLEGAALRSATQANSAASVPTQFSPAPGDRSEVVYIVRPGGTARGDEVLMVRHPSPQLLDQLMREAKANFAAATPEIARAFPRRPRVLSNAPPVMRGQSMQRTVD